MKPTEATLRDLYERQRLSTRAIGEQFGVKHITVRRWLQSYGISARAVGRGLDNRGSAMPSAEQLTHWIHTEHLSYTQIGGQFGVDHSAVGYWVRKYGIVPPTIWGTRYKGQAPALPNEETLRALYDLGESHEAIGGHCGISAMIVRRLFRDYGITPRASGWDHKRFACADGHSVRSTYEQRVDDWLTDHHVAHVYEPVLPFDRRGHADFLANGWYIEIWGVDSATYRARKARKLALYRADGLPLLELHAHQFNTHRQRLWERRLSAVLTAATFFGLTPDMPA